MIFTDDDFLGSYATDRENPRNHPACDTSVQDALTLIQPQEPSETPSTSHVSRANLTDTDEVTAMIKRLLNDIIDSATTPKIKVISVVSIKPYPKALPRKASSTGRSRLGKSRIYTSTPEKNRLEELEQERKLKQLTKTNTKRKVLQDETISAETSAIPAKKKKPKAKVVEKKTKKTCQKR